MTGLFEHIDVGHELQPLRLTLSSEQVRAYAQAANMPGGRFFSDEAARQEGLPGQIVPGNMSMALFSRLLAESLPGMSIKHLSATFRAPVRPGQPIVVHGVVIEKHCTDRGDLVECDLVVENADGERWVTGTATVQLAAGPTATAREP
ncbi:MAG: MaoC family dehydratase [Deltaproteobacteria bacterium]|nr:MaoC family dehydratase [Deltaproteobacteria bacterium]